MLNSFAFYNLNWRLSAIVTSVLIYDVKILPLKLFNIIWYVKTRNLNVIYSLSRFLHTFLSCMLHMHFFFRTLLLLTFLLYFISCWKLFHFLLKQILYLWMLSILPVEDISFESIRSFIFIHLIFFNFKYATITIEYFFL